LGSASVDHPPEACHSSSERTAAAAPSARHQPKQVAHTGQKRTNIPAPTPSKVSNKEFRVQAKAPFEPHFVNRSSGWRPVAMLTPCVVEACKLLSQQALKTLSHAQPSIAVCSLTRQSSKFIPTSVVVIDHHSTRAKHLRPAPR
jgi:hypothetical protein